MLSSFYPYPLVKKVQRNRVPEENFYIERKKLFISIKSIDLIYYTCIAELIELNC